MVKYSKRKKYSKRLRNKKRGKKYSKRYKNKKTKKKKHMKKIMRGGNGEVLGSALLAGAAGGALLGVGATGATGLAVIAGAGNAVKQASKNNLCQCSGNHYGLECEGCLKPSSSWPTPFCPAAQNCCRGRFQNMFGRDPLININTDGIGAQYVCKQCLSSQKKNIIKIII